MSKSVKDLIAEGKLDEAAVIMMDGLRSIYSRAGLGIDLTRDEFLKVSPNLIKVLEEGMPEPGEPTDDPGDDIDIVPAVAELVVTFVGPEGDEDFGTLPDYTKRVTVGGKYTFAPYTVVGYTPDKTLIEGTMTKNGAKETVTYTKDEPEPTPIATHVLTITYTGPEGFTAPPTYTAELEEGEEYMVISPEVTGFTPDKANVSGAMGTADVAETVTYAAKETTGVTPDPMVVDDDV